MLIGIDPYGSLILCQDVIDLLPVSFDLEILRDRDGLEPEQERLHVEEPVADVILRLGDERAAALLKGSPALRRGSPPVSDIADIFSSRVTAKDRADVLGVA